MAKISYNREKNLIGDKGVRDIVTDGEMEQMMYMRKAHFQQKYISMVHNFNTKLEIAVNKLCSLLEE